MDADNLGRNPASKSPLDLWNYQEIIHSLKPSLVIEFGTWAGGSAKYFASVLRDLGRPFNEAIREYFRRYPGDYPHDTGREKKFGFTFTPKGFLIRR